MASNPLRLASPTAPRRRNEWRTVVICGGANNGLRMRARRDSRGHVTVDCAALFFPSGVTHYVYDEDAGTLTLPDGYEQ